MRPRAVRLDAPIHPTVGSLGVRKNESRVVDASMGGSARQCMKRPWARTTSAPTSSRSTAASSRQKDSFWPAAVGPDAVIAAIVDATDAAMAASALDAASTLLTLRSSADAKQERGLGRATAPRRKCKRTLYVPKRKPKKSLLVKRSTVLDDMATLACRLLACE